MYVAFLTAALVYFEINYFDTFSIVLFAEGCFCFWGFLFPLYDFRIVSSISTKNIIGILVGAVLIL